MLKEITKIHYMVSFEEFPIRGGEYDLTGVDTVMNHLTARLMNAYPNAEVVIWADHPEYNTRKDFVVESDTDNEFEAQSFAAHIWEQITYELLPEAMGAAEVNFEGAEV